MVVICFLILQICVISVQDLPQTVFLHGVDEAVKHPDTMVVCEGKDVHLFPLSALKNRYVLTDMGLF